MTTRRPPGIDDESIIDCLLKERAAGALVRCRVCRKDRPTTEFLINQSKQNGTDLRSTCSHCLMERDPVKFISYHRKELDILARNTAFRRKQKVGLFLKMTRNPEGGFVTPCGIRPPLGGPRQKGV